MGFFRPLFFFLVRQRSPWEQFLSPPPGWKSVGLSPGWKSVGLSPGWENRTDIFVPSSSLTALQLTGRANTSWQHVRALSSKRICSGRRLNHKLRKDTDQKRTDISKERKEVESDEDRPVLWDLLRAFGAILVFCSAVQWRRGWLRSLFRQTGVPAGHGLLRQEIFDPGGVGFGLCLHLQKATLVQILQFQESCRQTRETPLRGAAVGKPSTQRWKQRSIRPFCESGKSKY